MEGELIMTYKPKYTGEKDICGQKIYDGDILMESGMLFKVCPCGKSSWWALIDTSNPYAGMLSILGFKDSMVISEEGYKIIINMKVNNGIFFK